MDKFAEGVRDFSGCDIPKNARMCRYNLLLQSENGVENSKEKFITRASLEISKILGGYISKRRESSELPGKIIYTFRSCFNALGEDGRHHVVAVEYDAASIGLEWKFMDVNSFGSYYKASAGKSVYFQAAAGSEIQVAKEMVTCLYKLYETELREKENSNCSIASSFINFQLSEEKPAEMIAAMDSYQNSVFPGEGPKISYSGDFQPNDIDCLQEWGATQPGTVLEALVVDNDRINLFQAQELAASRWLEKYNDLVANNIEGQWEEMLNIAEFNKNICIKENFLHSNLIWTARSNHVKRLLNERIVKTIFDEMNERFICAGHSNASSLEWKAIHDDLSLRMQKLSSYEKPENIAKWKELLDLTDKIYRSVMMKEKFLLERASMQECPSYNGSISIDQNAVYECSPQSLKAEEKMNIDTNTDFRINEIDRYYPTMIDRANHAAQSNVGSCEWRMIIDDTNQVIRQLSDLGDSQLSLKWMEISTLASQYYEHAFNLEQQLIEPASAQLSQPGMDDLNIKLNHWIERANNAALSNAGSDAWREIIGDADYGIVVFEGLGASGMAADLRNMRDVAIGYYQSAFEREQQLTAGFEEKPMEMTGQGNEYPGDQFQFNACDTLNSANDDYFFQDKIDVDSEVERLQLSGSVGCSLFAPPNADQPVDDYEDLKKCTLYWRE